MRAKTNRRDVGFFFFQGRERTVGKNHRALGTQVFGGAEGGGVIHVFGCPVDPGALGPIKGHLLPVHGEEVLTKKLTQVFKQETETADHRIVPFYGAFGLKFVDDKQYRHHQHSRPNRQHEQPGKNLQRG